MRTVEVVFRQTHGMFAIAAFFYLNRERTAYAEQCARCREKLEKENAKVLVKNRFIAILTHEIRNFVAV